MSSLMDRTSFAVDTTGRPTPRRCRSTPERRAVWPAAWIARSPSAPSGPAPTRSALGRCAVGALEHSCWPLWAPAVARRLGRVDGPGGAGRHPDRPVGCSILWSFERPTSEATVDLPVWAQAGLWGLIAGSALVIGAAVGYYGHVPARRIAVIMAFGSGVLISTLSFDLMDEAYQQGAFDAAALGFLGGAVAYTWANRYLARRGARDRKRSAGQQPSESEDPGSGLAIAVGALLDGVPESIVIGTTLIGGANVS